MVEKIKHLGGLVLEIAWAAVILLLPITSLPLLSRLAGGIMVAPASLIPIALLAAGWVVIIFIKRGKIPRESIPFLLFFSIACISALAALFIVPPPFKGENILGEVVNALVTLLIGAAFYLVTAGWLHGSTDRLIRTFKLVDISGIIMLLWGGMQAIFIFFFHSHYPQFMVRIQQLVSTRSLFIGRITSFAFEPSWLAQQLNLVFLPFWLAATISGWSPYRFRLGRLRIEAILLVAGATMLFLSSRVGTLAFLLVLAFLSIYLNVHLAGRLRQWSLRHIAHLSQSAQKILHSILPVLMAVVFMAAYFLIVLVLVYGLSHVDERLASFFEVTSLAKFKLITRDAYQFFNYLSFAERYVYWEAGWKIFNISPIFGVGLGNAGFYFQKTLPSFGWYLPEVMDTYYRFTSVPNVKSMWVRLLAETGIVGFSSFLTWFLVVFKSSWSTRRVKSLLLKTSGWFGVFVIIAYVIEGFSTDTFALPYLWISLGIVSAAAAISRNQVTEGKAEEASVSVGMAL